MKNYKKDFPIFSDTGGSNNLVYCDSAATTQKPQQVIDRITEFYTAENASVYRGLYALAEHATEEYEAVRRKVAEYIGAEYPAEIVFTHGATESINMVAQAWAVHNLTSKDVIVLTELEHHSNIIPWQQVAKQAGAKIKWIPVLENGELDYSNLDTIITENTKLVAITAWSNVLGIPTDLEPISKRARAIGARIAVDAAQAAPRTRLDVRKRGFDFVAFSGHKMLGPTGIGALFVKQEIHPFMAPYQYGGGMVFSVEKNKTVWRDMPYRCEAGTPPIAQVIGLGSAIDYLNNVDFKELKKHEAALCAQLIEGLKLFKQVKIIGSIEKIRKEGHCVSFTVDGFHAHDIAAHCDKYNIALRAGHHCAQPLHTKLNLGNSVRVSFYLYNTTEDVDKVLVALKQLLG